MNIERKTLKSISELSAFKVLLITYLIFFILYVIIFGLILVAGWAFEITDMLQNLGQNYGLNIGQYLDRAGNGVGIIAIVGIIIGGLIASVLYAAFGTLIVWIMNVILKISGGVELRFVECIPKEKAIDISKEKAIEKE